MPDEKPVPSPVPAPVPSVPPVATPPTPVMVDEAKYKAAVREMNLKQQEAALLKKELELERKAKALPQQQPVDPNQEPPEHIKKQLEAQFNMPYEHINLMDRMLQVKNKEIAEVKAKLDQLDEDLSNDRYENTKSRLKADDPIFDEFMPEIEAKLNLLPVKQRTNKDELAKIKSEVMNEHLPEIIKLAEERGRNSIVARPPTPPEVNSPGGYTPPASNSVTHLTAEQKAQIERSGGNVQEVEDFVSGKNRRKSSWSAFME